MDWVRWTLNVCFNKHAVLQLIQHAVDLARQIPRRCAIDFSCCGIQMPIVEGIYSMEEVEVPIVPIVEGIQTGR